MVLVLAFAANRLILVALLAVSFPSITFFIFYFFSVLLVVFVWRVGFAVLAGLDAGAFGTILRSRADASHRGEFMAFTGLLGFANGVGRNIDPFGDDLSGDLQAVEDATGGFGADALGDERIEGLGDGGADGGVVLGDGDDEVIKAVAARGGAVFGVVVAEVAAARGWGLVADSVGLDMTTGEIHGYPHPPCL